MYITFIDYTNGNFKRLTVNAKDVDNIYWDHVTMKDGTVYSDVSFVSMDIYYAIVHDFYEYRRNNG